jgi:hypothetical protein
VPSQKSQHYVPQFLLRRFSQDGASIGLHNLKSGRQIEGASLKHQACRDWFYGRDGHIEKVLSQFEGDASTVLRSIEEAVRPPRRYGVDHHTLATFLHIQAQRTAQAVSEANEMLNKMGKSVLRRRLTDPELLDVLDDVEMSLTDPTDMTLRRAILDTPVILDLKFKLLHNVSGSPFILGDHPVIKHNQLYEGAPISLIGLANTGLQILLPIGPTLMVAFYDQAAYTLGDKTSNVVRVVAAKDVRALNEMQWANALENVYFRPPADTVDWIADGRLAGIRRDEHVSLRERPVEAPGGRRGVMLTMQTRLPSQELPMPLFKPRIPPPTLADEFDVPLRDRDWAFGVHRLKDALDRGEISFDAYWRLTTPPQFRRAAGG